MADPKTPSSGKFVAMMAMLFATTALAIDAMLPALPAIGAELSPGDPNKAQLVVALFFAGLGCGTLIAGPVSDAIGRKATLAICAAIYLLGAVLCVVAPSLEVLLVARFVQGIGASGPRAVGMAVIRDLFKGRDMARVVSLVMMIFAVVPAMAPLLGQAIMLVGSWRLIFVAFIVFGVSVQGWIMLALPETLKPEHQRKLHLSLLRDAAKEMLSHRIALISTLCQTLTLACLVATLSSQQGIFEQRFERADSFPIWFAVIALCSILGSFTNSRTVVKYGMRAVIVATYAGQISLTLAYLLLAASGLLPEALVFSAHILWSIGIFAMMGLSMGNLNALAMEDLGHIAGFATSMITAVATVASVLIAVPVGLAFDGTQLPLLTGVAVFSGLALWLMRLVRKPGVTGGK